LPAPPPDSDESDGGGGGGGEDEEEGEGEEEEEEEEQVRRGRGGRRRGGGEGEEDVPVDAAVTADFGHYTAPHTSSPSRTALAQHSSAARRASGTKNVRFSAEAVEIGTGSVRRLPPPPQPAGEGGEWEVDYFGNRVRKLQSGKCCSFQ
jgi:hypothetical protein